MDSCCLRPPRGSRISWPDKLPGLQWEPASSGGGGRGGGGSGDVGDDAGGPGR